MIQAPRPEALDIIPAHGSTARNWALQRFHTSRAVVRTYLREASSKVHISCDMWTSPNGHALLGVVGSLVYTEVNSTISDTWVTKSRGIS
jgi:hypothetical protein